MPACRICLHTFKLLKFQTEHIGICTRCVNTLNESPEPAKNAEARLAQMLRRGMQRNAERDLQSDEEWKRRSAQKILENIDEAVASKLHDWITGLLKKPDNSTRDFKIMRAHRRGLLRMDGFADYPPDWKETAQRIRKRDKKCMVCNATNTMLDVHHIVYLSHQGTNQQNNLITLCRKCHETEHDRIFDWPEAQDPESASPIQPPPGVEPLVVSAPVSELVPVIPVPARQANNQKPNGQPITTPSIPKSKAQDVAVVSKKSQKIDFWWKALIVVVCICGMGFWSVVLMSIQAPEQPEGKHGVTSSQVAQVASHSAPKKSPRKDITSSDESSNQQSNSLIQNPLDNPDYGKETTQISDQHKQQAPVTTHLQKIFNAHPNADDLVLEPAFKHWSATPRRQKIMQDGSSDEVIKVLNDYNAYKQAVAAEILHKASEPSCVYKSVMSDADYLACGISPPTVK